jgi:hypothetical protein
VPTTGKCWQVLGRLGEASTDSGKLFPVTFLA